MKQSDFWSNYAEAMEMTVEGNRLIAREITDLARALWQRAMRSIDEMLTSWGRHGQLPPV